VRICKIYDADYPWDVRVEKILSTLVGYGHDVHLVCRNLKERPIYECLDRVHIHRLPRLTREGINYAVSFPAFCNPIWIWTILRVVKSRAIDLIIVRDLPLALAAILVGRLCRVPVILDMAEHYPAMIRDAWRYEGLRPANLLLRNPLMVSLVERACVRWADMILTVIEESKSRLMEQYHLDGSKVSVVSNTPRLSEANGPAEDCASPEPNEMMRLIYVGGLEAARTLDVVLRGMALEKGKRRSCLTVLGIGNGAERLRELVRELEIEERVSFKGWVGHSAIGAYIRSSDIGIVPHPVTAHTNTTVPNKLFDYMAHSKPVLASDTRPVQRIVQSEACGLIYRHDSPRDFQTQLARLGDSKVRVELGTNGRTAVCRTYNWGTDSSTLLQVVAHASTRGQRT